MDEALSSVPPPAAPPPAQAVPAVAEPPSPDPYTVVFPIIVDLTAQKSYDELVRVAEEAEISATVDASPSHLLVTIPLVLTYLILDQIPPARYALERLPPNLASQPLCIDLHHLLSATYQRDYPIIYARVEQIDHLVSQPDFAAPDLVPIVKTLLNEFIQNFRQRTFVLLSKAYSSLSLQHAQIFLGLASEALIQAIQAHQWTYDASTHIVRPKPISRAIRPTHTAPSSLASFDVVADGIVGLEI